MKTLLQDLNSPLPKEQAGMDKRRVYWCWQNGRQVKISWCDYQSKWHATVDNSGRTT